ncbi:MAG: serine/threonine protein kinase, partial [Thermoleophilia bacterium]|nr:serine/threonine protein kinase [Thermoleophilia bacterium]
RNGIVHRNTKPQNMLIDAEGRLKIADFGIARAGADAGLTEVGSIVGTAQYLSPEQARGQTVSATSDLYSLGVVLFEMATGRVPFDGDNPVNVALRHVNEQPPRPSMIRPGLSPALEAVILRSLQKEPSQRYQTADELLADLDASRGGTVSSQTAAMTAILPQATTIVQPLVPPITRDAGNGYAVAQTDTYDDYRDEEAEERKSKWWIWLLVLVLLLGGIGAWYFTAGPGGGTKDKTPKTVTAKKITVPDVTGKQSGTAIALLRDRGFQPTTPEFAASDTAPKGTVISTNPDGGTKAAKGAQIDLVVSSGKQTTPLLDVVGKTEAEARQILAEAGFDDANIRTTEAFSDQDKGIVVTQTPKAGSEAAVDQRILLVISKGTQEVAVPNVVGMPDAAATTKLKAAGFVVDHTSAQDDSADKGTVLAQSPTASGNADKGSTVTLTLASGFNTVPDVTAMSPSEAEAAIQDAGFVPQVTSENEDPTMSPGDPDRIPNQSPNGGQRRSIGATVGYVISHAPPAP